MVKKYHSQKKFLVLEAVKKYPLYSVNKLTEILPQISRHSIQRILEKNDLSTIEKRLAFAEGQNPRLPILKKKLRLNFDCLKKFFQNPRQDWQLVRKTAFWVIVALVIWQALSLILGKPPTIVLEHPGFDHVNEGQRLLVTGTVSPKNSQVRVNQQEVYYNGSGGFTALVNLPLGESVLEVEANYRSKRAKVVRLVKRVLTEEELKAQVEEEEKKKREVLDQAAEMDSLVKDLAAAKDAAVKSKEEPGGLKIINNHLIQEGGTSRVVGEVVNLSKETVSWVTVTARFYNESKMIDEKVGFAVGLNEVLAPNQKAEFETQVTLHPFNHYSLSLAWEKGEVAGAAIREATASGEEKEGEVNP